MKKSHKTKRIYDFLGYLFIIITIVILVKYEGEEESTILGYFVFSSFTIYFTWVLLRGLIYKDFRYGDIKVSKNEDMFKYYGCIASSILFVSLSILGLLYWR